VVVRGRGIVASRIIQRISEARKVNPNIGLIHSIRSRLDDNDGAKWGRARRVARNNVELQPFNWPKSCWTGDLRREYEAKGLKGRSELNLGLGGTTTADRTDWQRLVTRGAKEGWYRPVFGNISGISPRDDGVTIDVRTTDGHTESIQAHYLVDCTGLIGDIVRSPFLADLLGAYNLPRNAVIRTGRDGQGDAGGRGSLRHRPFRDRQPAQWRGTGLGLGHDHDRRSLPRGRFVPRSAIRRVPVRRGHDT
jgi:hypothetical protein